MGLSSAFGDATPRPGGPGAAALAAELFTAVRAPVVGAAQVAQRAEALGRPLGPYTIQAAIAGCHARARIPEETDWLRIVALYDALVELTGSPVVELNRAVAISRAYGPAEALSLVEELTEDRALRDYHLLPAVRGDLLLKLGRTSEAKIEFERAARMTGNARERNLLLERAAACLTANSGPGGEGDRPA